MNRHSIENETVRRISQNEVELTFRVPASCDFFEGHFDQFKLLPAVAQTHFAVTYAAEYFSTSRSISKIRRMKFLAPILPETEVVLVLSYNPEKKSVTFTFSDSSDKEKVYSTGSFITGAGEAGETDE